MAGRKYERLDIYTFGRHLIETGDLDPIYIALNKIEWGSQDQLFRWLIAYWCLYHAGAACYISEAKGSEFWKRLMQAAKNDEQAPNGGRWPRGHERRHFRGEAAVKATKVMWGKYLARPEQLVEDLVQGAEALPFKTIALRAQELPLFGPWISFKVCDMLDRLGICKVDFDEAAVFMFDDPTKAALMLWRQHHGLSETAKPKDQAGVIHAVVDHLKDKFKDLSAPPLHERPVDLQEVETVLCKWKSHMNGHYPLWNDIDEIRNGVALWKPCSRVAHEFAHHMPARTA
jgi:hypothetical protein